MFVFRRISLTAVFLMAAINIRCHVNESEEPIVPAGTEIVTGSEPDVSSDGKTIAYTLNGNIMVCDSSGKSITQFTSTPNTEFLPKWSPDGTKIGFFRVVNSEMQYVQLIIVDISTKTETPLFPYVHTHEVSDWKWSPDGRMVSFIHQRPGEYALVMSLADGSGPGAQSVAASNFSWSPDSKMIAFTTELQSDSAYFCIKFLQGDSTSVIFKRKGMSFPRWMPDGIHITYVADGKLMEFNNATQEERGIYYSRNPKWLSSSPDGSHFSFLTYQSSGNPYSSDRYILQVINVPDSALVFNTSIPLQPGIPSPCWSPWSTAIYFVSEGIVYRHEL